MILSYIAITISTLVIVGIWWVFILAIKEGSFGPIALIIPFLGSLWVAIATTPFFRVFL